MEVKQILENLKIKSLQGGCNVGVEWFGSGDEICSFSPVDGSLLGKLKTTSIQDYEIVIGKAEKAFKSFRKIPAPKRGELVRQFGNKLRENKLSLGYLVSWEMGKSIQEGFGEVQEMIDICDFAIGHSRQLYGFTMLSLLHI